MKRETKILILSSAYNRIFNGEHSFMCSAIRHTMIDINNPPFLEDQKVAELLHCDVEDCHQPWYPNNLEGQRQRLKYLKNRLNEISSEPLTFRQKLKVLFFMKRKLKTKRTYLFLCPTLYHTLVHKNLIGGDYKKGVYDKIKYIPEIEQFKPDSLQNGLWFDADDQKSRIRVINKTIWLVIKNLFRN